jgi:hypothetical protein
MGTEGLDKGGEPRGGLDGATEGEDAPLAQTIQEVEDGQGFVLEADDEHGLSKGGRGGVATLTFLILADGDVVGGNEVEAGDLLGIAGEGGGEEELLGAGAAGTGDKTNIPVEA